MFHQESCIFKDRSSLALSSCHNIFKDRSSLALSTCHIIFKDRSSLALSTCHNIFKDRSSLALSTCHNIFKDRSSLALSTCHNIFCFQGGADEQLYSEADLDASMDGIEVIDFMQTVVVNGIKVRSR
jgi:Cft2 family RNA processing exonuclease